MRIERLIVVLTLVLWVTRSAFPAESILWGRDLTQEEQDAIRQMSDGELFNLLETTSLTEPKGHLRCHYVLSALARNGLTMTKLERLVKSAEHKLPRETLGTITGRMKTERSMDEEASKRLTDRFIDLMEEDIDKGGESKLHWMAVKALSDIIYSRDRIAAPPGAPPPKIPYANDRVTKILIRCLEAGKSHVRETAVRALGANGANDLSKVDSIIQVLEAQRPKEEAAVFRTADAKESMLRAIDSAIARLRRDAEIGRQLLEPSPPGP